MYDYEKHRPSLTIHEMQLCTAGLRMLPQIPAETLTYLDRFIEDVQNGKRKKAFRIRPTLEQQLEVAPAPTAIPYNPSYDPIVLYQMYKTNGSYAGMNPRQIDLCKNHAISIMTDDEKFEMYQNQALTPLLIPKEQAERNSGTYVAPEKKLGE